MNNSKPTNQFLNMRKTVRLNWGQIESTKVIRPEGEERCLEIRLSNAKTDYVLNLRAEHLRSLLRIIEEQEQKG